MSIKRKKMSTYRKFRRWKPAILGPMEKSMIFDMPECGGCRTCEIACSFKHLGKFNADVSSLQVLYRKDGPGYKIRLVEDGESNSRFPCDLCPDREVPECVEYCHEREKLIEILAEFKTHIAKKEEN